LEAIGPPPHLDAKQFGTRVRWASNFGGVTRNETYGGVVRGLLASLLRSSDYSMGDVLRTVRGITATQAALLPDLATLDLVRTLPRLDVPVVMVQGRLDQVAPGDPAERYVSALEAPSKQLIWFENSAHTPQLEEPEKFRELMMRLRSGQLTNSLFAARFQRRANDPEPPRQRSVEMQKTWMLYGAAGHTGSLIATRAVECGNRPVLAGRSAPAVTALAEHLGLPRRVLDLGDSVALESALDDVDLVLNVAGPFLHTAEPLARACLSAGVHYLDISNELQVFRSLYDLDEEAKRVGVSIIPGAGFGVVATNCLARYVSEAVGGADQLEVASRVASAQPGPGAAATMQENLPYGGWIRQGGQLVPKEFFTGVTTIGFPDGPCEAMPVPTGDLEAAFHATGAPDIVTYAVSPPAHDVTDPDDEGALPSTCRSFGWARATAADGATAEAWLQTGDSYAFTAAASIRAIEKTLAGSKSGALSPAVAFGADFAFTIQDTKRIDPREMSIILVSTGESNG
jgi:short subunit dehydrogenase-like uncharacterized protein